jgi:hypothetical protein
MLGAGPPEHGLRGGSLILTIAGLGVALFAEMLTWTGELRWSVPIAAGILAGCVFVAQEIRHHRCWAWFFVMGWLVLMFAPALLLLPGEFVWPRPVSYGLGVMVLGWIHWLWTRRGDFLPDARIDALRRRERRVTAEWRGARLSRMGPSMSPVRPPPPVPGALWTRRRAGRI